MFDKELMRQLRTIPTENRAEWFAERDKLDALADEMTRLNVNAKRLRIIFNSF